MKKSLIVIVLFLSMNAYSQNEMKPFRFYVSPSIHVGFFSPTEVNDYIATKAEESNLTTTAGSTDLIVNFNLGLGLGFRFVNIFEFQTVAEYSIAPKFIVVTNGESLSYTYSRFSGGLIANLLIPLSSDERKTSFIIGGGLLYHNLSFEEYKASTIAPRFQIGISLNNNKFNPQILISGDFINASDGDFNLNYSGVRIGANLNF